MLAYQSFSSKDFRRYIKKYLDRFPLLRSTELFNNSKNDWWFWIDVETDIVIAVSSINTTKEIAELEFLEVSYGWRGKGIGSFILGEIEKSYDKLIVFPLEGTTEFYERFGFKKQSNSEYLIYKKEA